MTKQCTQCQQNFTCTADTHCWCTQYPAISWSSPTGECYCADCLLEAMAYEINYNKLPLTPQIKEEISGLGPPKALKEGIDYTLSKGLMVLTRWYLLRRGQCCDNRCKSCPY